MYKEILSPYISYHNVNATYKYNRKMFHPFSKILQSLTPRPFWLKMVKIKENGQMLWKVHFD